MSSQFRVDSAGANSTASDLTAPARAKGHRGRAQAVKHQSSTRMVNRERNLDSTRR